VNDKIFKRDGDSLEEESLNERYTIRFSNMKSPEEWRSPERKKAT